MTLPSAKHTATVVMLHGEPACVHGDCGIAAVALVLHAGLGDTGDGWADVSYQFKDELKHVKFVFPTAPQRPISLNMGMRMTGWYDIASLQDINQKEDAAGLLESQRCSCGSVSTRKE